MPEPALEKGIHGERGNMTVIEHDRVPERDRPLVVGVRREHLEELPRPGPVLAIGLNHLPAIDDAGAGRRNLHQGNLPNRAMLP